MATDKWCFTRKQWDILFQDGRKRNLLYKYSVYIWQIQVVLYSKAEMSSSFPLYKGAHKLSYFTWIESRCVNSVIVWKVLVSETAWSTVKEFCAKSQLRAGIIATGKQTGGLFVHLSALLFASLLCQKRPKDFHLQYIHYSCAVNNPWYYMILSIRSVAGQLFQTMAGADCSGKNHSALKARLPRVYHHESIYVEHHGDWEL